MSPLALVLLKLAAIAGPLGALAWLARVYPRRPMVYLALVPGAAAFGLLAAPGVIWLVVAIDIVLAALLLADLATLPRRDAFSVTRRAGRIASLGKPHPVRLTVSNLAERSFWRRVRVRDGVPPELNAQPDEFTHRFKGQGRDELGF